MGIISKTRGIKSSYKITLIFWATESLMTSVYSGVPRVFVLGEPDSVETIFQKDSLA